MSKYIARQYKLTEDGWLRHVYHLAGNLFYQRDCKVCNLRSLQSPARFDKEDRPGIALYNTVQDTGRKSVAYGDGLLKPGE